MTEFKTKVAAPARPSRRLFLVIATAFLLLLSAALIALFLFLQSDREALILAVEKERLEQVDTVVLLVEEDVDDVMDDLELIGRFVGPDTEPRSQRSVLLAVLGGARAYRAAGLYGDASSEVSYFAHTPRNEAELEVLYPQMDAVAESIRSSGEPLQVSPIISVDDALFRVFGISGDAGAIVVLAVETTAWLSGIRHLSSDPQNRVLVLGPAGRAAPASDKSLRAVVDREGPIDELLDRVLREMREGKRGTARAPRHLASDLGLADADFVIAHAPIRLREQELWSLATFTSLATLRAQERALVVRFGVAGGTIILLFLIFAVYIVIAARRNVLLHERLLHAAEVADLHAQLIHAEKLATVGGLSAGIAHEIGTPLGVIRGRAEYVLKKLGADDPLARSLRTITEQIDRVSRIIRELLDFARPHPASSRATDLTQVCNKSSELMEIEFETSGIALTVDLAPDLPPVAADPDQLQQVLVNLLVNARDACSQGDSVVIRASRVGERVIIEVRDDGPGIPEEFVNQVFDPFFTTKKRGHGTGLGLSVVSQIVRSHGGEVEIESTVGEGTAVRLHWPVSAGNTST